MTIQGTATLTSSGDPKNPKLGDVLDYRVTFTGDTRTVSVAPGTGTDVTTGQPVTVNGGPWTFTFADVESVGAPAVTGTLTKPFTVDPADPHHYTATI